MPAQQPTVGVTVPRAFSVALKGRLTLSFVPNAMRGDEPAIQFASGGRIVDFTIPAGGTAAMFGDTAQIAFQSGTVAGTIDFRAAFTVDGTDVTASPAPTGSVTIARAAPAVRTVRATRTPTGLRAEIVAFATSREVTKVDVQFLSATGANLGTTRLTLDVAALFAAWYASADAAPFGSLFTLTIPFTAQGDPAAARAISVILSNGDGDSQAVEAAVSP